MADEPSAAGVVLVSVRRASLVVTIVAGLLAACNGSGGSAVASTAAATGTPSAGPSTSPAPSVAATPTAAAASAGDSARTTPFQGSIDVAANRYLSVRCVGSGSPTILLEGGGVTPSLDDWGPTFQDALGATTTTCAYSRAGGSGSPTTGQPRTMAGILADVDAMLAALKTKANVSGPYVFVGTSLGGAVALAEALHHPTDTAGLVILDTDFPADFVKVCRAQGRTAADCQAEFDSDSEAKSMELEVVPKVHPLTGLPIAIVSAMVFTDCTPTSGGTVAYEAEGVTIKAKDCATLATLVADKQLKDWRRLGPQVGQTRVQADHDGLIGEAGDQIVGIVQGVVTQARASQ